MCIISIMLIIIIIISSSSSSIIIIIIVIILRCPCPHSLFTSWPGLASGQKGLWS